MDTPGELNPVNVESSGPGHMVLAVSYSYGPVEAWHRRAAIRSVLRVAVATAILLLVYARAPVQGRTGAATITLIAIGVVVFAAVLAWQLRTIRRANYPRLRAAESLAVAFVLLVLGFSFAYLSLSHGDGRSFSEHLDRVAAVYFTLSVITTVGFGDIAAHTDAARIVVIVQFILDLAIVFGVARLFLATARTVFAQRSQAGEPRS